MFPPKIDTEALPRATRPVLLEERKPVPRVVAVTLPPKIDTEPLSTTSMPVAKTYSRPTPPAAAVPVMLPPAMTTLLCPGP
jgi:hypothetical protein